MNRLEKQSQFLMLWLWC